MSEAVLDRPVSSRRTPVHLWIVGVLSLLWNLGGVHDYLGSQLELEYYIAAMTPEQLAFRDGYPAWMVSTWAFGVWGAFAGSVGLLLRKRWAVWAFLLSLVGLLGSSLYNFVLTDGIDLMGPASVVFTGLIFVVAIALFFYSRAQAAKGVLT